MTSNVQTDVSGLSQTTIDADGKVSFPGEYAWAVLPTMSTSPVAPRRDHAYDEFDGVAVQIGQEPSWWVVVDPGFMTLYAESVRQRYVLQDQVTLTRPAKVYIHQWGDEVTFVAEVVD